MQEQEFVIVAREVVAVTPNAVSEPTHIIYAGQASNYTGGIGAFDEGDVHIFRWTMKLLNLTPHDINVDLGYIRFTIPASGQQARVEVSQQKVYHPSGLPMVVNTYGEVQGLPDPQKDTIHIVSTLVLEALKRKGVHRNDVVAPDTGPESAIRDDAGRIVGVRRFQTLS